MITHMRRMPNHELYLIGGRPFPVMDPPAGSDSSLSVVYGRGAVEKLVELNNEVGTIRTSNTLTDLGKVRRIAEVREVPYAKLVRIANVVEIERKKAVAEEARIFAPPPIEGAGAESAILDREIRDWVRGLAPSRRSEALSQLAKNPRMVLALVRSPIRIGIEEDLAQSMWRDLVESTKGEEVAKARFELEAARWAQEVTTRVVQKAVALTGLTSLQQLALIDREKDLEPSVLDSLGFTSKAHIYSMRRANEQASPLDPNAQGYLPELPPFENSESAQIQQQAA